MALKYRVTSLEDVPDGARDQYVQDGDGYVLQVEGAVTAADLDRVREAMGKRFGDQLAKAVREIGAGLSGKDAREAIKEAVAEVMQSSGSGNGGEGGGGGAGAHDPAYRDLERKVASLTETLASLEAERDASVQRARDMSISGQLTTAATAAKANAPSVELLVNALAADFETTADGAPRTKEGSRWGADKTPAEVIKAAATRDEFSVFWPGGVGGGAGSGGGGGGDDPENPWLEKHWSLSRQVQIESRSEAEADRLAAAAGTFVGALKPGQKAA